MESLQCRQTTMGVVVTEYLPTFTLQSDGEPLSLIVIVIDDYDTCSHQLSPSQRHIPIGDAHSRKPAGANN